MGRLLAMSLAVTVYLAGVLQGGVDDRFFAFEGTIDIAGGTAPIPVMKGAAERIVQVNRRIRITVGGGGSGVGVQKVGEGLVDIGTTGRALSPEEEARYGLRSYPFAVDGVAVVVHPSNPIADLTGDQIHAIYTGTVQNWNELGGNSSRINLYGRDEASGTRDTFWKKLLKKDKSLSRVNVVPSNGAMKVAVSNDPNAIGYISIGHIDSIVKALSVDGIEPTQENAQSGEYYVVRMLYMNTKGEPSGLVKEFIDYVTSPEMDEVIQQCAYIPTGPEGSGKA